MTIEEMRAIDALKTYKELEMLKSKVAALEKAGDELCAAGAFMGWHDKVEEWNKAKGTK